MTTFDYEEFKEHNRYRFSECVYDLTTIATTLIHDYDIDVDSRMVFDKVYNLAKEFENTFNDEDDYMLAIEEFGYKRLMDYFKIKRRFKGCVTPFMRFEVEADSIEEAEKIIKDKLNAAGFQTSGNIMNDIVFD